MMEYGVYGSFQFYFISLSLVSQWEYDVCWTLNVENIIAVKLPTMMIAFTFNDDDSSKTVYSTLIISHSDFKMLWVRKEKNHV